MFQTGSGRIMNNKYGDKRMKLGNQFTAKYLHILLKETASETQNRAGGFLFDLICVRQAPGGPVLPTGVKASWGVRVQRHVDVDPKPLLLQERKLRAGET